MKKLHKVLMAALRGENASACVGVRRRVAGVRRVAIVGFMLFLAWEFAEATHADALHEGCKAGVEGVIAFIVERLCIVE
ncbi:hypothetical protein [Paraburkholderia silvatlantica]|uniref:hypothetical protein n=1 Tax=Paraburkholderia silvatlantica TaxID=321895 RepID=UPI003753A8C2